MGRFTLPRDLYHGKGSLEELKNLSGSKAVLVVGGGSMKRFGFLDRAEGYLKEAGMEVRVIDGVEPDPSVETVMKGAEAMRREFTANVTHELKTPLASISGAAELIKSGIVKPKDIPDFAGRIYSEAQRLASLVNDILMLSKLDESERSQDRSFMGSDEPVDLYRVAHDVVDRLGSAARKKQVSLQLEGRPVFVRGLPRLLDEMVQNLCSNAIRYNKEGGSVKVTVATTAKMTAPSLSTAWSRGIPIKPLLAYTVPNRSTTRVSSGLERKSRGTREQNTT